MWTVIKTLNQLSDKQLKQLTREFESKPKSNRRPDLMMSLLKLRQIGGRGHRGVHATRPFVELENDEELIDDEEFDVDNIDNYVDRGPTDPDEINQLRLERDRQIREYEERKTVLDAIYEREVQGLIEIRGEDEVDYEDEIDEFGERYDFMVMATLVHSQLAELEQITEFDLNARLNLDFGARYLIESQDEYERFKNKYYESGDFN